MDTSNLNFNGISPEKINLITEILRQSENVGNDNLIPFFLNAAAKANANGINFTDEETDIIIDALKTNMTKAQINKIDTIKRLSKIIAANKV